jgi:demethylmenaquinone methyltransferase / 2-methoxy-6-polyprenyl-1,4-benzoquinol methylase
MYKQSAPETIQALFASIAQNYDRANTIFTFGLHKKWNQRLIAAFKNSQRLLDLCAGTGEILFGFLKQNPHAEGILLDFCPEMLAIAQKKGVPFQGRFETLQADAQAIPLGDRSVDGVCIAYGIRNVQEPTTCFREVYRVLAPGGCFGILELTRPSSPLIRRGHALYTRLFIPLLGKIVAKNKEAYHYLVKSVETFSSPEVLETSLQKVGFRLVQRTPLMGGVATLLIASH